MLQVIYEDIVDVLDYYLASWVKWSGHWKDEDFILKGSLLVYM